MAKVKDSEFKLHQELDNHKDSTSPIEKSVSKSFQEIKGIKTRFSKESLSEDLPKTQFDLWNITDLVNAQKFLIKLYKETKRELSLIYKAADTDSLTRREMYDIKVKIFEIDNTLEKIIFGTYKKPTKKEFSNLVNALYNKHQKVFKQKSKVVEFYHKEFGFTDNEWTLSQAKDYCKKY